jgi:hypothetical protein
MPFRDVADPEKLAMLTALVDDICDDADIERTSPEYADAAYMVMRFYWAGYRTSDQLKAAIHKAMGREHCG